jgi:hypothetical protein
MQQCYMPCGRRNNNSPATRQTLALEMETASGCPFPGFPSALLKLSCAPDAPTSPAVPIPYICAVAILSLSFALLLEVRSELFLVFLNARP